MGIPKDMSQPADKQADWKMDRPTNIMDRESNKSSRQPDGQADNRTQIQLYELNYMQTDRHIPKQTGR